MLISGRKIWPRSVQPCALARNFSIRRLSAAFSIDGCPWVAVPSCVRPRMAHWRTAAVNVQMFVLSNTTDLPTSASCTLQSPNSCFPERDGVFEEAFGLAWSGVTFGALPSRVTVSGVRRTSASYARCTAAWRRLRCPCCEWHEYNK